MKKDKGRWSSLELASRPVAASDRAQQAMNEALAELSRETLADVQGGLLLQPIFPPTLVPRPLPGLIPVFFPRFPLRPGFPPLL